MMATAPASSPPPHLPFHDEPETPDERAERIKSITGSFGAALMLVHLYDHHHPKGTYVRDAHIFQALFYAKSLRLKAGIRWDAVRGTPVALIQLPQGQVAWDLSTNLANLPLLDQEALTQQKYQRIMQYCKENGINEFLKDFAEKEEGGKEDLAQFWNVHPFGASK